MSIVPSRLPGVAIISEESPYCTHVAGGKKCTLLACVEAINVVMNSEGYDVYRRRKFCSPHATKFAINASGHVRFEKIPMPESKGKS